MTVVQFQRRHTQPIDAIDPDIIDALTLPRMAALGRMAAHHRQLSLRLLPAFTDLVIYAKRGTPADTMSNRTGLPIDGCAAFIDSCHRHLTDSVCPRSPAG